MARDTPSHAAAVALFVGVLDASRAEAVALADERHTSVEEIAFVPLAELLEVKRIERRRVLEIRARAEKCTKPGGSE
jgi:N utilization substance protein A